MKKMIGLSLVRVGEAGMWVGDHVCICKKMGSLCPGFLLTRASHEVWWFGKEWSDDFLLRHSKP